MFNKKQILDSNDYQERKRIKACKKLLSTMLMSLVAVLSFMVLFSNLKDEKIIKKDNLIDPELARAMTYEAFEDGDQYVDGTDQNFQFVAFFLRDLDGDGDAEKYYGACSEVTKGDYLYIDINLRSGGSFKNGKILINGVNFKFNGAFPKDNEIPKNTISSDLKEIEFNEITNGMQKLFYGKIAARESNNYINLMSADNNTVTLTGTYVTSTGEEIEINKTITLTVDWYGTTTTAFHETYRTYNDLNSRIDETNGKLNLEFTINTKEMKNELLIKSNHVEGMIPQLNGYDPISVTMTTTGAEFNYDASTRIFTIDKEATVDADSKITIPAYTTTFDYSPSHRGNSYTVKVVYPIEAYNSLNNIERFKIEIPVREYYECFNNPNGEFDELCVSNIAETTYTAEFYQYIHVDRIYPQSISVGIGTYVSNPYYDYLIFKKKALRLYNGSNLPAKDDTYPVRWEYYSGTNGTDEDIVLKETPNDAEQKVDVFVKADTTTESMEEITSNIGVYFTYSGPASLQGKFLNDEGEILFIDDETDAVLLTINNDNIKTYNSKNAIFRYDEPVKHVRVEIYGVNPDSRIYINHIKELDDDKIFDTYSREEFLALSKVRTTLTGYSGESSLGTKTANALYPEQYSKATISLSLPIISTQTTVENETIYITAVEEDEYNNRVGWHSGNYLVKLPEEIISVKLNSVSIDNDQVQILSYELIENEDGKFFKIMTKNKKLDTQSYTIAIDCDLTPDPAVATRQKPVTLYAFNDEGVVYIPETDDIYDINNNGRTNEKVNYATTTMQLLSPNSIITNQTISDFDLENTVVVSPQIAAVAPSYVDVESEKKTAKIGIQIKNNYSMDTGDFIILGKIPFEGNTDVLKGDDLGSEFTVTMNPRGIELPENLIGIAKVYYSENEEPTKDVSIGSNGWVEAEDVTDWTKIKTFLVDLKGTTISPDDIVRIYYYIKMPRGVEMNKVSYSQHAVYFSLITETGKLRTQIEPNKLGIRTAEKYNLNISKYQLHQNKLLNGATYLVRELYDDETYGEAKTAISNEDGVLVFKNLFAEIRYELSEIQAPDGYDVTENRIVFIGHVDSEGILTMEYEGEVREPFVVSPIRNEFDINEVTVHVEDEVLGKLQITKYRENTSETLQGARFKVTGKNMEDGMMISTNTEGIATIDEISLGEVYTIEEIKAPKGYYLNNQIITFKMVNNHGIYSIETFDGTVKSSKVVEEELVPTLKIELEDEKIPTYTLEVNKVSKGDDTPLEGVKFALYYGTERIGTYLSNEDGKIIINELYQYVEEKGVEQNYTLKETFAPEGYAKIKDIEFYVEKQNEVLTLITEAASVAEQTTEGTIVTIKVEDAKSFRLLKVDGESYDAYQEELDAGETPSLDSVEFLQGAKFAIYDISEGEKNAVPAKDSKGKIVGTRTEVDGEEYYLIETNENGEITANLPEGIYKAVEIIPSDEKYDVSKKQTVTYRFGIGKSMGGSAGAGNNLFVSAKTRNINSSATDNSYIRMSKTIDGGIVVISRAESRIYKYDENYELQWNKSVSGAYSVNASYDNIFIGTSGGNVVEIDLDGNIISTHSLGYGTVYEIAIDENKEIIIAAGSGLIKLNNFNEVWKVSGEHKNVIISNNEGYLTIKGKYLTKYSKDGQLIFSTYTDIGGMGIKRIAEDGLGNIRSSWK